MNHDQETRPSPPRWIEQLLERYGPADSLEEVQGDLSELYAYWLQTEGQAKARRRYLLNVLRLLRPFDTKRKSKEYSTPNYPDMLRNYLKIALRSLLRHKAFSFINIAGLSVGMAVAILIGLWIWDELSFNQYHQNYDSIAQVKQNNTFNGNVYTWVAMPYPMGTELRNSYGSDFKHVVMSSWPESHILSVGEKKFTKFGNFMEPEAPEMLTLPMRKGTRDGLKDPTSILLSESLAKAFFGDTDPVGKLVRFDNKLAVQVTGVYEDLPHNSTFAGTTFIAPWELKLNIEKWIREMTNPWGSNGFQVFVQLADQADMKQVSAKIKDVKLNKVSQDDRRYKPEVFLHPMAKWHLYSEFKNGLNTGGRIEFVWLFGMIGGFVLLLACINFMNLSTARSEKRAKEVGIRKAIGSVRSQLVAQFLGESLLMVVFALGVSLLIVQFTLPFFNQVADKKMTILWASPWFWLFSTGFSVLTGLIAGSYPALYLSSFQPVKVLKGTFRVGRFSAIPRKVLVVVQFTVSVTLIIGTIIVFRQIQFAKSRPVGYSRDGLVMIPLTTNEIHLHFQAVRAELKNAGAVAEMAESGSPVTAVWSTNGDFDWKGKDPGLAVDLPNTGVSPEYGKTVGWQFKEGRDFSSAPADSFTFVVNEAAVKFMGLKQPVGEIIKWEGSSFKIIGVIKDMIVESPYQPVRPSLFCTVQDHDGFVILKINPAISSRDALRKIETVFKKYAPAAPFDYQFVEEEYAKKFGDEERIGNLATVFATLAIFISCLGLFGLASFVAEQRTKEIGIRKVLGASVFNLWSMLSKDFVGLVVISCLLAVPVAWYFLHRWLQKYEYRTEIAWWVFATAIFAALVITLLTVSYQAIKAALANPVKSLRTE